MSALEYKNALLPVFASTLINFHATTRVIVFKIYILCIWNTDLPSETKREKILPFASSFPKWISRDNQDWNWLQPGIQSSTQVFHMSSRVASIWTTFHCFTAILARIQCSSMGCGFTCFAMKGALPRFPNFKILQCPSMVSFSVVDNKEWHDLRLL